MSQKRSPAKDVAKPRGGGYWIDHAAIVEADVSWLKHAIALTLWNVTAPPDFFAQLPNLAWLDIRGGSAESLNLKGAQSLTYLAVNQIRGLSDLSDIATLHQLRYLNLYGLAKLSSLPSLASLNALRRVEMGQMKILESIAPVLQAPGIRELLLTRTLSVPGSDVLLIQQHSTLEFFDWLAEDVPLKVWEPVVKAVKLLKARSMHPEAWFALQELRSSQGASSDASPFHSYK